MHSTRTTSTAHTTTVAPRRAARSGRAVAGGAVLAATLLTAGLTASSAGAVGQPAGDRGAPAATATPTCKLAGLKVTLDKGGVPDGVRNGMSHAGIYLRFENTTDHTCILRGYPGLGLENTQHKPLATKAEWGSTWYAKDPGKTNVRVEAGDSAWADLAWTQSGTDAVHSRHLKVTPPAETRSAVLNFDRVVDWGRLQVTALADTPPKVG
ncbi:DUF4232 domain-containing protein [Streptomyces sp. AC563]|uniref:DUF4232 domain-containing protein n=1 Tax=Streptomyces buecherae TaxID=2763006 RepID=UPI00164E6B45|nr:DUF4232 domain-containing protein [Streptomyces buecherae]MBC3993745.1 DUF4232 domain-containing protein [Streptomyces buecherae]